jgi:hypothetical protein
MVASGPSSAGKRVQSCGTRDSTGALPSREVGFRILGHVLAPEPSPIGRQVWSHGTRGSAGALSSREAGSGAPGHMVVPKPSSVGRRGPEPWYTWQHVIAHPTLCLGLMPVCEGTQSVGYRQEPTQWWQQ